MSDELVDFDKWQVFEVKITDRRMPGGKYSETIEQIAADNDIPAVARYDLQHSRHLIATPTAADYDNLMEKVEEHFQAKFEARMNHLKERYRKQPSSEPDRRRGDYAAQRHRPGQRMS